MERVIDAFHPDFAQHERDRLGIKKASPYDRRATSAALVAEKRKTDPTWGSAPITPNQGNQTRLRKLREFETLEEQRVALIRGQKPT